MSDFDAALSKTGDNLMLFKAIADSSLDGIFLTTASDPIIIYCNPTLHKMFGYDPEEMVGQPGTIFWDEEGFERLTREILPELLQGGWSGEVLQKRKDGTLFSVDASAFPLGRDANGIPHYVGGILRPNGEHKRIEREREQLLRETEIRLRISQALINAQTEDQVFDVLTEHAGLFPEIRFSIYQFDQKGNERGITLIRDNPFQSGFEPTKLIGRRFASTQFPLISLFSPTEPFITDDYLNDKRVDPASRKLGEDIGTTSMAAFPLTVDDNWLAIMVAISRKRAVFTSERLSVYRTLAEQGAVALRAAQLRSKVERSEARARALINAIPDLMFRLDENGIFLDFKPSDYLLVPPEVFLGHKIDEVMPPQVAEPALKAMKETLETHKPTGFEYQLPGPDGAPRDYESRLVYVGNGETLALVRDITVTKQGEAEQTRLQQEIIDAQQRALKELSTPIIPIMDQIIVMPLIGAIDARRAKDLMRELLEGITRYRARVVIIDITGVPIVDSGVASYLNKTIAGARLKGTHTIVTGISDAVAETIVDLGISWEGVETLRDLQSGLITALTRLGVSLQKT